MAHKAPVSIGQVFEFTPEVTKEGGEGPTSGRQRQSQPREKVDKLPPPPCTKAHSERRSGSKTVVRMYVTGVVSQLARQLKLTCPSVPCFFITARSSKWHIHHKRAAVPLTRRYTVHQLASAALIFPRPPKCGWCVPSTRFNFSSACRRPNPKATAACNRVRTSAPCYPPL